VWHQNGGDRTGVICGAMGKAAKVMRNWMIPILMASFALAVSTLWLAEESLAFYSLLISVMIAAVRLTWWFVRII